jgi:hypothetical protein
MYTSRQPLTKDVGVNPCLDDEKIDKWSAAVPLLNPAAPWLRTRVESVPHGIRG